MAMEFIYERGSWWELDREKLTCYNYLGGHHSITESELSKAHTFECENWHELYLAKHYCPFESDKRSRNAWISPQGKIYEATSHDVTAEHLLDIIYGLDVHWPGDELASRGWVRVTTSIMWDIRLKEWESKKLTQSQLNALWDWCNYHNKKFPHIAE